MQVCPKCGYAARFNGPMMLWGAAFFILYFVWMLSDYGSHATHEYRLLGLAAFMLFNLGTIWSAIRGLKHGRKHALVLKDLKGR